MNCTETLSCSAVSSSHPAITKMQKAQVSPERQPSRLVVFSILGFLSIAAFLQITKGVAGIGFRMDNTYPESAVVQTALWAGESGHLYPALHSPPFTPAPYGPVFYALLAALSSATRAGADRLMLEGRVLVWIAFLLTAVIAYRWQKRQRMPIPVALLAPLLMLSEINFVDWNISVRPDAIALLLTLVAFSLLAKDSLRARDVIAAGVLCGLTGLLKQSFIALPLAAGLSLLLTKQYRHFVVFAVSIGVVGFGILGVLAWRHEPFLEEILLARYSPVSLRSGASFLWSNVIRYPWHLAALLMVPPGLKLIWKRHRQTGVFLLLYFVSAWSMAFYTAMAPGSSVNALLEASMITAVIAPAGFSWALHLWDRLRFGLRTAVLAVWLIVSILSLRLWRYQLAFHAPPIYQHLAEEVRGHRILTDVPYVAVHSKEPQLLDPSVNHYLEIAGQWSPTPILADLQRGVFDYIIIGLNHGHARSWRGLTLFSPSILREVETNYRLTCSTDTIAIYVPRSRASSINPLDVLDCQAGGQHSKAPLLDAGPE